MSVSLYQAAWCHTPEDRILRELHASPDPAKIFDQNLKLQLEAKY
jgi:hypothetical protein